MGRSRAWTVESREEREWGPSAKTREVGPWRGWGRGRGRERERPRWGILVRVRMRKMEGSWFGFFEERSHLRRALTALVRVSSGMVRGLAMAGVRVLGFWWRSWGTD